MTRKLINVMSPGNSRGVRNRWNSEHGRKRHHHHYWLAALHAWRLNRWQRHEPGFVRRRPYACQWGANPDLGHVGEKHWHVGRSPVNDMWGYG